MTSWANGASARRWVGVGHATSRDATEAGLEAATSALERNATLVLMAIG